MNQGLRETSEKKKTKKGAPLEHGVGRRKSSVARVWLRNGRGDITVNKKNFIKYFTTDVGKKSVLEPIVIAQVGGIFSIDASVYGGGIHSQAGAIRLAISRALAAYDERYRKELKLAGLLTVDARRKERKKYGQKAARRRFQFVKR